MSCPDWVALVRNPSLPATVAAVTLLEAQLAPILSSVVRQELGRRSFASLLTAERGYKIKKPADFGFLDFSTLERRRHFCEEELRLNAASRRCYTLAECRLPARRTIRGSIRDRPER